MPVGRLRALTAAAVATAGALAAPAGAHAATVWLGGADGTTLSVAESPDPGSPDVVAGPAQVNDLVMFRESVDGVSRIRTLERNVQLTLAAGPGCWNVAPRTVDCEHSHRTLDIDLGGGNDHLALEGNLQTVRSLRFGRIRGGSGDDYIRHVCDQLVEGGPGNDRLAGGCALNTCPSYIGSDCQVETFRGGEGDDWIEDQATRYTRAYGDGGNDRIVQSGSSLFGERGDGDTYDGGAGDDLLIGSNVAGALLIGGPGADTFRSLDPGFPITVSYEEADRPGGVRVTAGERSDGDGGAWDENPGGARDQVEGSIAAVIGTDADDVLVAASGARRTAQLGPALDGRGGNDVLVGNDLVNHLFGGAGDDEIREGAAGGARNFAYGEEGSDFLTGGPERDSLVGGAGDDHLTGGAGADSLMPSEGSDVLDGGAGADHMHDVTHEPGDVDVITYADRTTPVSVDLGNDTSYDDGGAEDQDGTRRDRIDFAGPVRIVGGAGGDVLIGSPIGDVLDGGAGADRLDGAGGADDLDGGAGEDSLAGGADDDRLVSREPGEMAADSDSCGTGDDIAVVDIRDTVAPDCETTEQMPPLELVQRLLAPLLPAR